MNCGNEECSGYKKKALLSTVWIFIVLNYLYCDVLGLMDAAYLKQYMAGSVGGIQITQNFLLSASLLMEISISMVIFSRLLTYKINRWFNIISGAITTLVQIISLFVDAPTTYYVFFSVIEVSATVFVVFYAFNWRELNNKKS